MRRPVVTECEGCGRFMLQRKLRSGRTYVNMGVQRTLGVRLKLFFGYWYHDYTTCVQCKQREHYLKYIESENDGKLERPA